MKEKDLREIRKVVEDVLRKAFMPDSPTCETVELEPGTGQPIPMNIPREQAPLQLLVNKKIGEIVFSAIKQANIVEIDYYDRKSREARKYRYGKLKKYHGPVDQFIAKYIPDLEGRFLGVHADVAKMKTRVVSLFTVLNALIDGLNNILPVNKRVPPVMIPFNDLDNLIMMAINPNQDQPMEEIPPAFRAQLEAIQKFVENKMMPEEEDEPKKLQ